MIHKLNGHIVLYKILISTEKFKYNGSEHIDFTKYYMCSRLVTCIAAPLIVWCTTIMINLQCEKLL